MNDMPWIKSYPEGVRWDAEIVPGCRCRHPRRRRRQLAGSAGASTSWASGSSYRELGRPGGPRGRGLQQLGVGPGVHVGLYLPNTPHYLIAFFGVLKAGGTVVNYSPLDAATVLEHKIEDSRTDYPDHARHGRAVSADGGDARQDTAEEAGRRQPGRDDRARPTR